MEKVYNETYNDRIHKYTLNVPLDVWDWLKKRTAPGNEIRRISIYVNAVLKQHMKRNQALDMDIILDAKKDSARYEQIDARREWRQSIDKPVGNWWRPRIKKAFSLFQPKQQTFNFSEKESLNVSSSGRSNRYK
jgi:hypothetical protein